MASIPGGSSNPFGHKNAVRYLLANPRRFVVITNRKPTAAREVDLPITTKQAWIQVARDQARYSAEGLKQASEANLVLDYNSYRVRRAGKPLIRHRLEVGGAVLLSDAFDRGKNLLIEAKGATTRPAIRMAIGQLLDYRHALRPAKPNLAILLPQMPSDDLIELSSGLGIATIWRRPDATFWDSEHGRWVE